MENIILVSHGPMAAGVKASLEMIIGPQANVQAISLRPDGDDRQFETELLAKMRTLSGDSLIIADLFGGTPCNVSLKHYREDQTVGIVAGLSLPLVLEAATNPSLKVTDLVATAKEGIIDVKQSFTETNEGISESELSSSFNVQEEYAGKAKIVNARIDERLIHGQVAGIWSSSLSTQRLIVIHDEAANDPLQKSTLRMAAPSSMRLSVLTVAQAATNIASGRYGQQRLFVLFKNPLDVWRYLEAGGQLQELTVGNMSYKDGAREVTKSIKVMPEEEEIFRKVAANGVKLTAQLVPDDQPLDFIKKMNGN